MSPPRNCFERLLAGDLAQVAVHGADGETAFGEFVGDLLGGALGAGEDHRGAAAARLQHPADQLDLVHRVRAVDVLLGGVVHRRGVRRLGPDVGRLVHERAGQRDDRVRHGRREQHRLPLVGDLAQNPFDVGQEAQVEHLVGLVEHQHRQAAELQVALLGQVEQPPGRADHDVGAGAQRLDLRLVGPAAVDGHHRQLVGRRRWSDTWRRWPGRRYTCRQSSRVGTTINARGMPESGRSGPAVVMRCSSGTPNAKVLPIPVRACPIRSSPVSASGSVSSWMAKGCSMPSSVSACTISSRTPRSAKVVSDAAWLGVMSGVMREARMPFGFVFDLVNRCGQARTS